MKVKIIKSKGSPNKTKVYIDDKEIKNITNLNVVFNVWNAAKVSLEICPDDVSITEELNAL